MNKKNATIINDEHTQENIAKVYPILLVKAPVLNNINVLDSNRKQKNLQILGDERRTQKK